MLILISYHSCHKTRIADFMTVSTKSHQLHRNKVENLQKSESIFEGENAHDRKKNERKPSL